MPMKIFLMLIPFLIDFNGYSQKKDSYSLIRTSNIHTDRVVRMNENQYDSLKAVTIQIMRQLNIPIRYFLHRDDQLKFYIYQSKFNTAQYIDSSIGVFLNNDSTPDYPSRWCYKPEIWISNSLDSILKKQKQVSVIKYTDALGSIIHEFTHYYQQSYIIKEKYIEWSTEDFQIHILQLPEFEAYTVESYFFLSVINPKILTQIMENSQQSTERNKNIINAAFSIITPGLIIK